MNLYVKLTITVLLSLTSVILYLNSKTKLRRFIMIAMLLSTVGDFFMTDAFGIGASSTIPGALFFMAAHLVYGFAFMRRSYKMGFKRKSLGTYIGLGIMIISTIVLGILAFTIPEEKDVVWFILILLYISVIGFNLVCNFNYSYQRKDIYGLLLMIGITLFYATDYWIFLEMLYITPVMMKYVWYFYPIAQLMLILFSERIFIKGSK